MPGGCWVYLVGMTRTNEFAMDRWIGVWVGRRLAVAMMLMVLGAVGLCGGCASRADVTGGYAFVLRVSDAKRQLVYYELKDDGTLNFVGGVRAGLEMEGLASPTWSGKFTRAELDGVIGLIAKAGGDGGGRRGGGSRTGGGCGRGFWGCGPGGGGWGGRLRRLSRGVMRRTTSCRCGFRGVVSGGM